MKIFICFILCTTLSYISPEIISPENINEIPLPSNLDGIAEVNGGTKDSMRDRRDLISSELSEDELDDDPGFEEGTDDDIFDRETIMEENTDDSESISDSDPREETEMLEGFEGNRDPLAFDDEIRDEEKYFGKIPEEDYGESEKRSVIEPRFEEDEEEDAKEESLGDIEEDSEEEDASEETESDEQDDTDEQENTDEAAQDESEETVETIDEVEPEPEISEDKRHVIADSDEDILGTESSEDTIEDEPMEQISSSFTALEDPQPVEPTTNSIDYEKLLNEFEEDKEDSFLDPKRYLRDEIPRAEIPEEEEEDMLLNENEPFTEELTDDDETEFIEEIDHVIDESIEENEDQDLAYCASPNFKKNIVEYLRPEESADDIKSDEGQDASDLLDDTPIMSFDCADCVDIDESGKDEDSGQIKSTLSCPISDSVGQGSGSSFKRDILFSSERSNQSRKSDIYKFTKSNDFLCNEKCKDYKRTTIQADAFQQLSTIRLWNKINPDIKYHRIPRSSVAILVDGNLGISPLIMNSILNIMLLFSRNSMITLGVFRKCLKLVQMPGQPLFNSYSTYYRYIRELKKLGIDPYLGPAEYRHIHYALGDVAKEVNEKATVIKTDMKIVVVLTNGPFTGTGYNNSNLNFIKKQNRANGIKVYVIQLGSLYDLCQLESLTYSSKIIIVHYINQLIYGGRLSQLAGLPPKGKELYSSVQGVISILRRKLRRDAEKLVPIKGKITYHRGGIVAWASEDDVWKLTPIPTRSPASAPGKKLNVDEFLQKKNDIRIKKQSIPRSKRRQWWRRYRPSRRGGRRTARKIRRPYRSSRRITTRGRKIRSRGRRIPRKSTTARGLDFLRKTWRWTRYFPSLQKGTVKRANLIIMLDTMESGMIDIMQKLLYYTITPFPYTIARTSVFSMGTIKTIEICRRRSFARAKDIQRLATSISETRGKTIAITPRILRVLSPKARVLSARQENVLILILRHSTTDFSAFNYISKAIASAGIKLYVFGLGLEVQRTMLTQLSLPNRIFTSPTVESFFTKTMFDRIIGQFKTDLGIEEKVINLDSVTKPRPVTSRRPSSRRPSPRPVTSRRPSSRRPSQRPVRRPTRPTARRPSVPKPSGRRPTRPRASPRRPTRPSARPKPSGRRRWNWRNLFRKRRGRDIIERPTDFSPLQNAYILDDQGTFNDEGTYTPNSKYSEILSAGDELNSDDVYQPSEDTLMRTKRDSPESEQSDASLIDKRQRIRVNTRVLRRLISSDGSIGPGSYFFIVDGTFGNRMGTIRQFIKDITLNIQREGSYFTFATFASTIRPISRAVQFRTSSDLIGTIDKVRGVRSRFRNTGQALMETRRLMGGANPDYPLVVVVLLNGPSTDDSRVPASLLRRDGAKVIVMVSGRQIQDRETLSIQSSALLAFRTSFGGSRRISSILTPLFHSISGKRSKKGASTARNYVSQAETSKQWMWTTFRSKIRERKIAKTDVASLIDTTLYADRMMKLSNNIINSFSIRSIHLFRILGVTDRAALKMSIFRRFTDATSQQLVLLSLIGNQASRYRPRAKRRAGRNVQKRDLIEDLLKNDQEFDKGAVSGSMFEHTGSEPDLSGHGRVISINNVLSDGSPRPSAFEQEENSKRETRLRPISRNKRASTSQTRYRQGSGLRNFDQTRSKKPRSVRSVLDSGRTGQYGAKSRPRSSVSFDSELFSPSKTGLRSSYGNIPGSQGLFPSQPVVGQTRDPQTYQGYSDKPYRGDVKAGYAPPPSGRPGLSISKAPGRRPLSAPARKPSRARGRRPYGTPGQRPYRATGRRPYRVTGRRPYRAPGGRLYRRPGRRLYRFRRGVRCTTRTWRCLTLKLRQIGVTMRTRNYHASYGPNNNKLVIILLAGWPRQTRASSRFTEDGFRYAARNITRFGIRLIIIVMQRTKTRDRYAQPILRAASTSFIHGSWGQALSILARFQRTSTRLFGVVDRVKYQLQLSKYGARKSNEMSVSPVFDNILPPSTETYMTTKYLVTIQRLRRTLNWQQIIPGLRTNFLRGSLSVVIVVDTSKTSTRLIIKGLIRNIIKMFKRRTTRFTLVLSGRTISTILRDQQLSSYRQLQAFLSRVSWSSRMALAPRFGATLDFIRQRVCPTLRRSQKNLVILIAQRPSRDKVGAAAISLKNRGALISVIGIENKIDVPELQTIASSGQMLITGHVSMLPVMLFRLQFSLSLVVNGPLRSPRPISMRSSTRVRVFSTVLRGLESDEAQSINPLGRMRMSANKRDEISQNVTTYTNETLSISRTASGSMTIKTERLTQPLASNITSQIPQYNSSVTSAFLMKTTTPLQPVVNITIPIMSVTNTTTKMQSIKYETEK